MSETTTDRLAEIEGQAAAYAPPEGWRVLQAGEVLEDEDWIIDPRDGNGCPTRNVGSKVGQTQVGEHQIYIRRIEVEPEPENSGFEGHILREQPQPVQVREGRWRTRNGEVRHVTPTPEARKNLFDQSRYSWYDAQHNQTWLPSGHYTLGGESQWDLREYLGPIEPEPEKIITPDDVAAEALAGVWDKAKAEQEIAELRSEVSYVQGLLGDEKRRFAELETLTSDLRAVNAAQEKSVNSAARHNADLQHRLDTVAAEWAQQAEATRRLQIELDAREQVPQAVSDRFEEGWDKGTAQAVETIAEWTEVFRTCGSQGLSYHVMQNLPHIMRTLTGLTDED